MHIRSKHLDQGHDIVAHVSSCLETLSNGITTWADGQHRCSVVSTAGLCGKVHFPPLHTWGYSRCFGSPPPSKDIY